MTVPVLVTAEVKGLKELEANLKMLRESFGVKTGGVIIRGLRAGAKLIRDEARRLAPRGTGARWVGKGGRRRKDGQETNRRIVHGGLLKANIVEHAIKVSDPRANGRPTVLVRVRNSGYERVDGKMRFKRRGSSPGYWWLVEFGTSKKGARPFMRPAFESQKGRALVTFRQHVAEEIIALQQKFLKTA